MLAFYFLFFIFPSILPPHNPPTLHRHKNWCIAMWKRYWCSGGSSAKVDNVLTPKSQGRNQGGNFWSIPWLPIAIGWWIYIYMYICLNSMSVFGRSQGGELFCYVLFSTRLSMTMSCLWMICVFCLHHLHHPVERPLFLLWMGNSEHTFSYSYSYAQPSEMRPLLPKSSSSSLRQSCSWYRYLDGGGTAMHSKAKGGWTNWILFRKLVLPEHLDDTKL